MYIYISLEWLKIGLSSAKEFIPLDMITDYFV